MSRLIKKYRWLLTLIRVLVLVLSIFLLYKEFFVKEELSRYFKALSQGEIDMHSGWILGGVLLIAVNWGIETQKWRLLVRQFEHLGFYQAYRAVLTGLFISFFTPNRIGEFAGRVIYLHHPDKVKASLATIVGSFSQVLCTLLFGIGGFFYWSGQQPSFHYQEQLSAILWGLVVVIVLWAFFNLRIIYLFARWLRLPARWLKHLRLFTQLDGQLLVKVWFLSAFRYLIFSLQYYFLLKGFGIDLPLIEALAAVSLVFLVQTILPSFAFSELTLRGTGAQQVFGSFGVAAGPAILVAYAIWLMNVFVPSIMGALLFSFTGKDSDVDL